MFDKLKTKMKLPNFKIPKFKIPDVKKTTSKIKEKLLGKKEDKK